MFGTFRFGKSHLFVRFCSVLPLLMKHLILLQAKSALWFALTLLIKFPFYLVLLCTDNAKPSSFDNWNNPFLMLSKVAGSLFHSSLVKFEKSMFQFDSQISLYVSFMSLDLLK